MGRRLFLLSLAAHLGAGVAAPATPSAGEEPALPARLPFPPTSSPIDPREAPLFLLSRIEGVGRRGVATIARARRASRVPGASGADLFAGLPGGRREASPAPRPPFRIGAQERISWEEKGRRLSWRAEGARGVWGFSFLAEKDPGESAWNDFTSWSLSRAPSRPGGVALVAGDMAVRLGSGLLVGTTHPFGLPQGTAPPAPSRLVRYRSRLESGAHRGLGAALPLRGGTLRLVVTSTRRDARVDGDGLVSSVDLSGLHRTASEKAHRDRLHERIVAVRWEKAGRIAAGATGALAWFDPPLGGGDARRKPDAFRGGRLAAGAVDFQLAGRSTQAAVEVGTASTGGGALITYLRRGVRRRRFSLRGRLFSPRFHTPRGTIYHRLRSKPSGEMGWLLTGEGALAGRWRFRGRFHDYRSLGRTYRSEGTVRGIDWDLRVERPLGPGRIDLGAGGGERSEFRGGRRVAGASLALFAGGEIRRGRGRFRVDARGGLSRSPGGERLRRGSGLSFLVSRWGGAGRRLELSLTLLGRRERALPFPSPSFAGSFPFAWFGGGRGRAGVRLGWSGFLPGALHGALLVRPGGLAVEITVARVIDTTFPSN